jgi:hypothetical protein
MKQKSREEKISFIKGVMNGTVNPETINMEHMVFITHSNKPGVYIGDKDKKEYSEEYVNKIGKAFPEYITVIEIVHPNYLPR